MRTQSVLEKTIINFLHLFPYMLNRLIPRRKDIWVFGAWYGQRYADNSRYVFDYVCENEAAVRAVWLSRSKEIVEKVRHAGKEAHLANSWMGYWLCCRASLVFVTCCTSDVNRPGALGAKKIQLWHGTPLKKIGLDDPIRRNQPGSLPYRVLKRVQSCLFPFLAERYDLIISASPVAGDRLATAFGVDQSVVKTTGYPRGDIVLNPHPQPVPTVESFKQKWNAHRVVCYVPTHRGMGQDKFDLFSGLDVRSLHDCLARHNAVMFTKMHYYHRDPKSFGSLDSNESRIHWLSEEEAADVNPILAHTDVLITDYSSVYFDYLLLDRPILFAPFDKDRYLSRERELYEDYDTATPGPKCGNWDELIQSLDRVLSGEDGYGELRRICRDRYNSYVDTHNCRRVVELAKGLL